MTAQGGDHAALPRDPEVPVVGRAGARRQLLTESGVHGRLPHQIFALGILHHDVVSGGLAQTVEHGRDQSQPVRDLAARQPVHLDTVRRVDRERVGGVGHLDERDAAQVARCVLEDPRDRRRGGLVADQAHLRRVAGRVLDAAAVLTVPTRADDQHLVADGRTARPERGGAGQPRFEVQHEVDDHLGRRAADAQLAHRVGAHRAALGLGHGEVGAPPVVGVAIDGREDAGCRREHDLDARIEHVAGGAELGQLVAAEGDAHEARRDALDGAHLGQAEHVRRAGAGRGRGPLSGHGFSGHGFSGHGAFPSV